MNYYVRIIFLSLFIFNFDIINSQSQSKLVVTDNIKTSKSASNTISRKPPISKPEIETKKGDGTTEYNKGLSIGYDDCKKARYLFDIAAKKGKVKAMYKLAEYYGSICSATGDYVDKEKCFYWFRKAIEKGSKEAMYDFGVILFDEGIKKEGLKYIEKSADLGYEYAIDYLVNYLEEERKKEDQIREKKEELKSRIQAAKNNNEPKYVEKTYDDGSKYKGYTLYGIRNGHGSYTWADGAKFEGEFKDGIINGHGTYTRANGDKYAGDFKEGIINGHGTYTYAGGAKFEGEFKDGTFNGHGTYIAGKNSEISNCPRCKKHEGNYKDGKKNGKGKCYDKNDKLIYEGRFENDIPTDKYPSYGFDSDGDGVIDTEDLCVDVYGKKEFNGCQYQKIDIRGLKLQFTSNGLARLKFPNQILQLKWGFVNKSGDVVIPFEFEKVDDFIYDKAKVTKNNYTYYIDFYGNCIQDCQGIDSDTDGIIDIEDECPFVEGEYRYKGCPDSDGDGIGDSKDRCPFEFGTKQGCP